MMQRFLLTNLFAKRSKYSSRIADVWFVKAREFIRVIMFIRLKKLNFFIYESFDQFAWSKSCLFEFYNLWRVGTRQLFNSSSEFVKWNHFIQRFNLKKSPENFQCFFSLFSTKSHTPQLETPMILEKKDIFFKFRAENC